MPNIKLQSSDNEIFETDIQVVKCSGTLKTMLEDCGMDQEDEEAIVPLPNVKAHILRLVLQWANQHKDDPSTADDDKDTKDITIPQWDADFLKVERGVLFELMLAANYLDIKGLLDVISKTIAEMLKSKSPEAIRTEFKIPNDFTAEEQEEIRKEDEWCNEK